MPEIEHASSNNNKNSNSNALFDKYELGRLLGCGAFAKVYHGRNMSTGQSVAVKVINKEKITNPALVANIKREITIMRRLRHPNIVRLHEVLATRTKAYFIMDFVKGGELFARVAKGHFSEDLSRKYFRQLISAVGYCHSRGVYHRDLKPENLLVDDDGDLKVSDFGLSAVKDQLRADGLLHTLCGTPAYVAPEILTKKGYDGAKVDVWSSGVILYVLTVGCLPFNDSNLMNMYRKIYKGEFRCPKWMSMELKRFLSRLLDTNPKTRITIDEIKNDPWFKMGIVDLENEINFQPEYDEFDEEEYDFMDGSTYNNIGGKDNYCQMLNAFDLISFSSSLNLSGLFDDSRDPVEELERFVSEFPVERIMERVEGAAMGEKLRVRVKKGKKKVAMELEGEDGCFAVRVEISRLTEQLVVVEVARRVGEGATYDKMWKQKLRPELGDLVYRRDEQVEITPPPSPPPLHDDDDE